MRRLASLLLATLAALVLTGTAEAGWREDLKVLRVGFIAGDNPSQEVQRLEPFRFRLQSGLAVPVELFPARSYQALIEAEASGRIQYAVLSSLAYIALDRKCGCAEPLVQPVAENAARGFRALLVSRADGGIRTLDDAKGMRLAVGRKDSISGRLVPLAGLDAAGIVADGYFANVVELPDSLAALRALGAGEADLSVAWSTASDPLAGRPGSGPIAALAGENALPPGGLRIVWQSDLVPFGPHAVRKDLPPEAKAALRDTLIALQADAPEAYDVIEPQFSGGFVEADPALYDRFALLVDEAARP